MNPRRAARPHAPLPVRIRLLHLVIAGLVPATVGCSGPNNLTWDASDCRVTLASAEVTGGASAGSWSQCRVELKGDALEVLFFPFGSPGTYTSPPRGGLLIALSRNSNQHTSLPVALQKDDEVPADQADVALVTQSGTVHGSGQLVIGANLVSTGGDRISCDLELTDLGPVNLGGNLQLSGALTLHASAVADTGGSEDSF